ncbi:GNAT family N-acetyltransferase [Deinococcus daejeonensis]|nr:GNAT family N-acetyltransferase [Deinococcus daejeonensis]
MLHLRPMDAGAFARFLARAVPEYAAEKVRSGQWSPEEAQARSEREFQDLLPQGPDTPDNILYTLHDPHEDADVGVLWYALQRTPHATTAFIYEVEVFEAYRRRGYATQAFTRLEADAAARALYEKLGYHATNINMRKELRQPG